MAQHYEFSMTALFYQWIDLLWVPVGLLAVHKGQRLMTATFVLAIVFMLRIQLELMASVGHPDGFLHLIDMGLFERGLVVYGFIIAIFLILAYFSPDTKGAVFMAACLSLYFIGFFVSTLAMLL